MQKGYDNASWFYDRLSGLLFGRQLQIAQAQFLNFIPVNARVLIVGGGSGWILEELAKVNSSPLDITYVDASPKMVAMAKKRVAVASRTCGMPQLDHQVNFIAAPIQQVDLYDNFDVVITPFFFDNFQDVAAREIFRQLNTALKKGGIWLYTDFRDSGVATHKLLLKCMYLFFSLLCGVKARKLPDMGWQFTMQGFALKDEEIFLKGFVESRVWVK